jgi:hypothetical protein
MRRIEQAILLPSMLAVCGFAGRECEVAVWRALEVRRRLTTRGTDSAVN